MKEFIENIASFDSWPHSDKIKLFTWYLHTFVNRDRVNIADVRSCYVSLNLPQPASLSSSLYHLNAKSPKQLLKDGKGYYLTNKIRTQFDGRYGTRPSVNLVTKMLQDLPSQVTNFTERTFLDEAILCFKCGASRAAIVMTWNLAYDHFCNWVYNNHVTTFNQQLPKTFPKANIAQIAKRDDFSNLKDSEVLQVCKSANLITGDLHKVLKEKLDRRNTAAHPSNIVITSLQAEDFITDLVNNVVVKLV